MGVQDKAIELVEKYKGLVYPYSGSGMLVNQSEPSVILANAKICAKIAVDELILWTEELEGNESYWKKVLKEIDLVEM